MKYKHHFYLVHKHLKKGNLHFALYSPNRNHVPAHKCVHARTHQEFLVSMIRQVREPNVIKNRHQLMTFRKWKFKIYVDSCTCISYFMYSSISHLESQITDRTSGIGNAFEWIIFGFLKQCRFKYTPNMSIIGLNYFIIFVGITFAAKNTQYTNWKKQSQNEIHFSRWIHCLGLLLRFELFIGSNI